jgi:hypothetical protein
MTPEEVREANDLLRMIRDSDLDGDFGRGTSINIDLDGRRVVIYLSETEIGVVEAATRTILEGRRSDAMLRLRELGVDLQGFHNTATRKLGSSQGSESHNGVRSHGPAPGKTA